jgi:hypothetical protein
MASYEDRDFWIFPTPYGTLAIGAKEPYDWKGLVSKITANINNYHYSATKD